MRGEGRGIEVYRGSNSSEAGVQMFLIMCKASGGHSEAVVKSRQQEGGVLAVRTPDCEDGWAGEGEYSGSGLVRCACSSLIPWGVGVAVGESGRPTGLAGPALSRA